MPLLALPRELQLELVERLDYESLVSLSITNKHFRELQASSTLHFRQGQRGLAYQMSRVLSQLWEVAPKPPLHENVSTPT